MSEAEWDDSLRLNKRTNRMVSPLQAGRRYRLRLYLHSPLIVTVWGRKPRDHHLDLMPLSADSPLCVFKGAVVELTSPYRPGQKRVRDPPIHHALLDCGLPVQLVHDVSHILPKRPAGTWGIEGIAPLLVGVPAMEADPHAVNFFIDSIGGLASTELLEESGGMRLLHLMRPNAPPSEK